MKNNKVYLSILLFIFFFGLFIFKVNAYENLDIDLSNVKVNDTFEYNDANYTISQVKSSDIYIRGEKLEIYNFEVYVEKDETKTWRKYVKLEDLCKQKDICTMAGNSDKLGLKRDYHKSISGNEISYVTYMDSNNTFNSEVMVGNEISYTFNTFKDENTVFNSDGSLVADVEPLLDKNDDLYVPLRFVTEALGAEVVWQAKEDENSNDKVNIDFYDDDDYCRYIKSSYSNSCKKIAKDTLNDIKKCDSDDDECLEERCQKYIEDEFDNLKDSFELEIYYDYIDIKDKLRKFQAIYDKNEIFKDDDSLYIMIMYNGVPIPYDILENDTSGKCEDEYYEEKYECLSDGKSWITDENMIILSGGNKPFCGIEMEKLSISSET